MGPLLALCILFLIPMGCLSQDHATYPESSVDQSNPACRSENITPTIREDAEPGTVVTPLIIEPDHVAEVTTPKFGIDGTNLILTEKVDYEVPNEQLIQVIIQCKGKDGAIATGQTIYVEVLNVNDNAPVFKEANYTFTILESLPVNSPIGAPIEAEDADGDTLYYELIGNDTNAISYLRLSSPTYPQLLVNKPLDYDLYPRIWLNLTARDTPSSTDFPSFTATTVIMIEIIDADDKPPFFQPCTPIGTKICINSGYSSSVNRSDIATQPLQMTPGPIYAVDGDYGINADISYSIIVGNENSVFSISDTTGNITMNKAVDTLGTIVLQVMAYQTNEILKYSTTTVRIEVKEKNNFPPIFQNSNYLGTISETAGIRSFVLDSSDQSKLLQVFAYDADFPDGVNPAVTYSIANSTDFTILRDGFILSNSVFTSPGTTVLLVNAADSTTSDRTTTIVTIAITPAPTTTTTTTTTGTGTTTTTPTTITITGTGTTTTTTTGTGTTATTTPFTGTTTTTTTGTGTTTTTTPFTGTTTTTTTGTGTTTTTTPSTGTTTNTNSGTGTTITITPSTGTTASTTSGTGTTTTTTPSTRTTSTATGTGTTTTTTPSTRTTSTATGTGTTTTTTPSTGTTTSTTTGTGTTATTTPTTGTTTSTTSGTGTTTTTSPSTRTTSTTTGTGTTATTTPSTGTTTSTTPGTATSTTTHSDRTTSTYTGTTTDDTLSTHTTISANIGTGTEGAPANGILYYTATDMAILGATLGAVLALSLAGLAFFTYKQYGNTIRNKFNRGFGNNSGGSEDRIAELMDDQDNVSITLPTNLEAENDGYIAEVSTGDNLMAAAAVSTVLLAGASAGSQPSEGEDEESDSEDKKMKSILTKDLKENVGYKSVWFREDATPEVMVIEEAENGETNDDSEEENNSQQGDDEEEEDEDELDPTFTFANNDSKNYSVL